MKLITFPSTDTFSMLRQSLTDILQGDHLAALLLHAIVWWSETLTQPGANMVIDTSRPGPWMWFSDLDIERRLAPYEGKSLYASKAIHRAVNLLVEKGYIETRFDPVQKLNRRRQGRLINLRRLQEELDGWKKRHPRMEFGVDDLALPFSRQYDGEPPWKPVASAQKEPIGEFEKLLKQMVETKTCSLLEKNTVTKKVTKNTDLKS